MHANDALVREFVLFEIEGGRIKPRRDYFDTGALNASERAA
jgi:limonene-1,2-epoxide hydrolase